MIVILTFWLSMPLPSVLANAHDVIFFGETDQNFTMTNCQNIWVIGDLRKEP